MSSSAGESEKEKIHVNSCFDIIKNDEDMNISLKWIVILSFCLRGGGVKKIRFGVYIKGNIKNIQ